ncbi:MAG: hypothetical protein HGA44_04495 [Cellulomonadaceae bacterium]|nr:hypothetical protein [Cellulomonadaceae bacterium]
MSVDTWMHFDPRDDLLESARECEAEVFLRWYGNTRSQLEDEYGPYDDASVFIALADAQGEVVAAMRLIAPGGVNGLKVLNDVGREPWGVDGLRSAAAAGLDLRSTWEIATISARRRTGGQGVRNSYALYRGLSLVARANLMSAFVAVLDERVRRLLDSAGLVTNPLPGTGAAPYLGSEASTPIFAHGVPLLDNQRRHSPEAFALITQGVGLDGISVPPDDAFRLGWFSPDWAPPLPAGLISG